MTGSATNALQSAIDTAADTLQLAFITSHAVDTPTRPVCLPLDLQVMVKPIPNYTCVLSELAIYNAGFKTLSNFARTRDR